MTALYRRDFVTCPHCHRESECRVDHLYGQRFPFKFGPWHCQACGLSFSGTVRGPGDVELRFEPRAERFTRSLALLRFEGRDGPVFFILDHGRYWNGHDDGNDDNQEHQQYFFEEHSCPTNWISECVAIVSAGDWDPHGFLKFVRAADIPRDFEIDDEAMAALFPEIDQAGAREK